MTLLVVQESTLPPRMEGEQVSLLGKEQLALAMMEELAMPFVTEESAACWLKKTYLVLSENTYIFSYCSCHQTCKLVISHVRIYNF